ncbi:MAG TPA: hypothetical protein VHZ51_27855, partial [Ktedonobacteraceae bacterium]|nr:hypothetical protein [Ktedonobacteraceae bacterium]
MKEGPTGCATRGILQRLKKVTTPHGESQGLLRVAPEGSVRARCSLQPQQVAAGHGKDLREWLAHN